MRIGKGKVEETEPPKDYHLEVVVGERKESPFNSRSEFLAPQDLAWSRLLS